MSSYVFIYIGEIEMQKTILEADKFKENASKSGERENAQTINME